MKDAHIAEKKCYLFLVTGRSLNEKAVCSSHATGQTDLPRSQG